MFRDRKQDGPDRDQEPEPVAAPRRMSPVAQLQRTLGNAQLLQMRAAQRSAVQRRDIFEEMRADQAVRREQRLEQQSEQVAVPSGGQALPAAVQARAEAQHGVRMDDVKVIHGADQATDAIGAKAFTTDEGGTPKVVMGSADMGSKDAQFTLMHELSHVAQQKKGMSSGLQGLGGDPGLREHLENDADSHAEQMCNQPGHGELGHSH